MNNGNVPNAATGAASHRDAADAQPPLTVALLLVWEILQLVVRWTYVTIEAIVRLIVPVSERSVEGEIVLITGTGHGIGREVALQYARLGAIVVCVDINATTNTETVQQIESEGGRASGFACDVTDRTAVFELIARVKAAIGSVSILVNNAGIMPCRPLLQQNEAEIRRTFDINVYAHFWLLQATLPDMVAAQHGHVVALSSVAGLGGLPNLVPYCGTKFAVKGMMEAMSEELRQTTPQIRFTTIYPYMVDTGLCAKPYVRFEQLLPLLRPADVAAGLIAAQRRGVVGCSLPRSLQYVARQTFGVRQTMETGENKRS